MRLEVGHRLNKRNTGSTNRKHLCRNDRDSTYPTHDPIHQPSDFSVKPVRWAHPVVYDHFLMNQYGSVWISMHQYGSVCISMDQYGTVWISMDIWAYPSKKMQK